MKRRIKCASGLEGWQGRLQTNYDSLEEFRGYDETYGLAKRFGYASAAAAWKANPVCQGSVEPSDFRNVRKVLKVAS